MSDWYAVIISATGEPYSFGTVIADPLPSGMEAIRLTALDADALNAGRGYWDAATRSVLMRPESEWPPVRE